MSGPVLLGLGWPPDHPGGANRYFRAQLEALAALGLRPRGVVLGPAGDAPAGVSVPAASGDPLLRRLRRYAAAVPRDASVLDAHFALYALPVLLRRGRRPPLVVHFHGPWADEARAAGEPRLACLAKRLVERRVYRRARCLVVLSNAFRRVLAESYGIAPWRVRVLAPGVDLGRFSPGDRAAARTSLGLPPDARVAVTVRRLVPRMGVDVLLDAWAAAGTDGAGSVLLVVGDGPERGALEAHAERLGLAGRVRFLGQVDEERLVECYRAADVCVLPSRSLEGYGLVVLESLACGTPAVVSDAGGLPEAVRGLDASLVVPAGDADALARRLQAPLPEREACRAYAEGFDWRLVAERTAGVYDEATRQEGARPIRAVYLDHTAVLSGAELNLLRLLPSLAGEVDAHVVLAQDGPLAAALERAGISVAVLPLAEGTRAIARGEASVASRGALGSAAYAVRLACLLRRLGPDVVHTNSLKAGLYGGLAGRLARVPVVWHLHDRVADDYLPARAVRLVSRAIRLLPVVVIANSQTTLATVPGAPRGRVVPCAVAPTAGTPARPDGPFRAGIVGRITRWKGQHVFLAAFARAFPAGPEEAVVVGAPLFGADDEAYLGELHALCERLGLAGRVEFTGFRADVPAELARLDVLVHASTIAEPFGQVVAEGQAAGLAVIASAAGGPGEMVADGVDGLLTPTGDVEALAGALVRLATDAALRARLGAAGRERSAAYAPEQVARQVVEAYREVLAR